MVPEPPPPGAPLFAEERKRMVAIARQIGLLFRQDAARRDSATRWIKGLLVLGGAALAAGAQFLPDPVAPEEGAIIVSWAAVTGWIGVGFAAAGGLWGLIGETTAPTALEGARRAVEKAKEYSLQVDQTLAEIDEEFEARDDHAESLQDQVDWFGDLYALSFTFREMIERQLSQRPIASDKDIATMLKGVSRFLTKVVEFDANELWTITIFKLQHDVGDKNDGKLVWLADARADRDEEEDTPDHRAWGRSEGVAGQVLVTGREIVVHDLTDTNTYHWLHVPEHKEGDEKRYRSIVGIPVLVGHSDWLWGVVIATSDRPNRFQIDEDGAGRRGIIPLRLLADMVALLLAPSQIPTPPKPSAEGNPP